MPPVLVDGDGAVTGVLSVEVPRYANTGSGGGGTANGNSGVFIIRVAV